MRAVSRSLVAVFVLVAGACTSFGGDDDDEQTGGGPEAPGTQDASPDAASVDAGTQAPRCAATAKFTTMKRVAGLEHATASNGSATLTADELTVVFTSSREGGNSYRLYSATRASRDGSFSIPAPVDGLGGLPNTNTPSLSGDGLALYFTAIQPSWDVYRASRSRPTDLFGSVTRLGAIDSDVAHELDPFATSGGTELWFASSRTADGGSGSVYHVYRSTFAGASFRPPERVLPADEDDQRCPVPSPDLRTLFLTRSRPDVNDGGPIIVVGRRDDPGRPFTTFAPVDELDVSPQQYPSWLSPDECRLYYTRVDGTPLRAELWVAERTP